MANRDVSLKLHRGEVLALLGENGAGKTTLMNILYGLQRPDAGQVLVRGQPVHFASPSDAIRYGIGMVHQHFMLVPVFTVTENIILGAETVKGLSLDMAAARRRIAEIAQQFGLDLDPGVLVKDLSVGQQQRVEIIKAFYRQAGILILDEPTAVLTPQETEDLFAIIRTLTAAGHVGDLHLAQAQGGAGRLRSHRGAAARRGGRRDDASAGNGAQPGRADGGPQRQPGGRKGSGPAGRGRAGRAGRAGVRRPGASGRRRRDLAGARRGDRRHSRGAGQRPDRAGGGLTGLRQVASGTVAINGRDCTNASPRAISETGCAHVPEDRIEDGLVVAYSVADNLVLESSTTSPPFASGPVMDDGAIYDKRRQSWPSSTTSARPRFWCRWPTCRVGTSRRWSSPASCRARFDLLIASQPTRGLDVGSIEFIHRTIVAQRDRGTAVLLVSADLDEVMALSDRIAVMYRGKIVAVLPAAETTHEGAGPADGRRQAAVERSARRRATPWCGPPLSQYTMPRALAATAVFRRPREMASLFRG